MTTTTNDIYCEANDIQRENNLRIDRVIKQVVEINKNLGSISEALSEQKEASVEIQRGVEDIICANKQSKRKISSISSIWGTIANKFTPTKHRHINATVKAPTKSSKPSKPTFASKPACKSARKPTCKSAVLLDSLSEQNRDLNVKSEAKLVVLKREMDTMKDNATHIGENLAENVELLEEIYPSMHKANVGLAANVARMRT